MARHTASWINSIADEGTHTEAVTALQRVWDELQDTKAELTAARELIARLDSRELLFRSGRVER